KIRFSLPEPNGEVQLHVTGAASKRPGTITVSNGGRYGEFNSKWYGYISFEGKFEPSRNCTPEIEKFLHEFAADPAKVAGEYGRLTGNCCFCGLKLTDERSTAVGYGPVCSEKYGLPWGERPAKGGAA